MGEQTSKHEHTDNTLEDHCSLLSSGRNSLCPSVLSATLLGIAYLPIDAWQRGFLGMSLLFLVTSTFTLAKVIP